MILPSDEDSRKPGDPKPPGKPGEGNPAPMPWDADEPPGFFDDEEDDDGTGYSPGNGHTVQSPAPPGWRDDLREALLEAVEELREIEDPAEDFDPPEPPDLFTFYGELAALRNEMRRTARRFTDSAKKTDLADTEGTRSAAMALVYLHDRCAGQEGTMLSLVESAMQQAGIQRVVTEGAVFDPATMVCDGPSPKKNTRIGQELEAGFLWNGKPLRPARVVPA